MFRFLKPGRWSEESRQGRLGIPRGSESRPGSSRGRENTHHGAAGSAVEIWTRAGGITDQGIRDR